MSLVRVVELAAWGVEASESSEAKGVPLPERVFVPADPLLPPCEEVRLGFERLAGRKDLRAEFAGLDWSLHMVDLRRLIAFQRRLSFDPAVPALQVPTDCAGLLALAFGPVRAIAHQRIDGTTIQSANPDLQLRPAENGWVLHGGSPFLEVTLYKDRAFLRDGYHRAYELLRGGVSAVPAVVIRAETPEEICPADGWFMPYDVLLGANPPLVTDFLDPALTVTYERPRLLKTIQLTVTESMEEAQ